MLSPNDINVLAVTFFPSIDNLILPCSTDQFMVRVNQYHWFDVFGKPKLFTGDTGNKA